MKKILTISFLFMGSIATANGLNFLGVNFAAPTVNGQANVTQPEFGAIILDTSTTPNAFKGNIGSAASPNWVPLSAGSANVSNPESAQMIIASASYTMSSSGTSCVINSNDGSWISTCTPNGVGDATLSFTTSFGSTPNCTATPLQNGNAVSIKISSVSTSGIRLATYETTAAAALDMEVHVICIGKQ